MTHMERSKRERPLRELFGDLTREVRTLARHEVEFAKAEMSEKLSRTRNDFIFLAAGASIAYAGLLGIMASAIIGLAQAIPAWLSALAIGGGAIILGSIFLVVGFVRIRQRELLPRHTAQALKQDRVWLENQMT